MIQLAGTVLDLLLVVVGFGFIVFVHELGHFAAARWARIRVLAFAIGFGPAAFSFRKGMGVRRGSSEAEYDRLRRAEHEGIQPADVHAISPTEYRLNWLPFGGYVKMLGQDDLNPSAISAESDSYQRCPAWKRMIVISAGVVMNIILAAILFVFVFMVGLRTEPPRVGAVVPGSPASKAVAEGVPEPGLKPGDEIALIDGGKPNSFNDLVLASAMAKRGRPIAVQVLRDGRPLTFRVTPEPEPVTGLLMIGVEPGRSAALYDGTDGPSAQEIREALSRAGLAGVEPGMVLTRVGDRPGTPTGQTLIDAVRESGGRPVEADFAAAGPGGAPADRRVTVTIQPEPAMLVDRVPAAGAGDGFVAVEHLLGLVPVLRVAPVEGAAASANARAHELGLKDGDVFARLGTIEYPGIADGVAEVRRFRARAVPVVVARSGAGGVEEVRLNVAVQRNGRIGFLVGDSSEGSTRVAAPLKEVIDATGKSRPTAAAALNLRPGSRILRIDGTPVENFAEMNRAIRAATAPANGAYSEATLTLDVELPLAAREGEPGPPVETVRWTIPADDARRLHETGWTSRVGLGFFTPEEIVLQARNPVSAVAMGLQETKRVMLMTYVTFARLFEGTVRVEHLKGPVGIAHLGTRIADRGLIWLLFFMGLISVNLAVVNFLPLPIVDGGQFLFLLYEQLRGKPVSLAIQNAATAAGLLMVAAVFLIVTFNDIANLFGG